MKKQQRNILNRFEWIKTFMFNMKILFKRIHITVLNFFFQIKSQHEFDKKSLFLNNNTTKLQKPYKDQYSNRC